MNGAAGSRPAGRAPGPASNTGVGQDYVFLNVGFRSSPLKPVGNQSGHRSPKTIGDGVTKAMEPQGGSVQPRSAEEAHDHMSNLLDDALAGGRSALMVTMEPLPGQMIDVKLGMMSLDQHAKGLLMVAFAVVHMNQKSGSSIKDDLVTLGSFVGSLIE